MDDYRRNSKGYALVTVLLLISIIMILTISFMGQALNTSKQSSVSEQAIQSADLAEMGAQYYKAGIMNTFDKVLEETESLFLIKLEEALISTEEDELSEAVVNDIRSESINEGYQLLKELVNNIPRDKEVEAPDVFLEIDRPSFNKTKEIVNLEFDVFGHVNNKTSTIKSKFEIDLGTMINISDLEENNNLNDMNLIKDPEDEGELSLCFEEDEKKQNKDKLNKGNNEDMADKRCKTEKSISFGNNTIFNNTILKVYGDLLYGNLNNHNLNDSLLYVTGDLSNGNQNNISNGKIYVRGDAQFSNLNGASNLVIEVDGNATFHNLNGVSNVTIVVKNNASFHNVKGNHSNVKICANSITANKVHNNVELYEGNCPVGAGVTDNINWETPVIINEKYDY